LISHCSDRKLIEKLLNIFPESLIRDIDVALYAKLSHKLLLEFVLVENTLGNRFKREIIRGISGHKPIIDLLMKEEVRTFVRTLHRVNQTSYIDQLKAQL
jgi:hypothetical protein